MNHIGLFEGIGGFSYAASMMGWETIAWCEINEFCQTVLKYHFPNAKAHSDIKTTDFTIYRGQCDILTGGFPCQPYSTAGKRLGKEDDRHLWPEMLRAIREIQPTWIVAENVFGLVNWNEGLVFEEVQADLEAEGYEVQPVILPACAVNAPHRRDRVWFIAFNTKCYPYGKYNTGKSEGKRLGLEGNSMVQKRRNQSSDNNFSPNNPRSAANSNQLNGNLPRLRTSKVPQQQTSGIRENIANSGKQGLEKQPCKPGNNEQKFKTTQRIYNQWERFPTQSPVCSRNDGFSDLLDTGTISESKWRNQSIKAYGNAIVPQVALQIFKAIEEYENTKN